MKIAAKITMAKRKFAIGPATTMAARLSHRLEDEALARARCGVHARQARPVGNARGILVAEEFHEAAERNGGDFPARAVAIVEADDFRAKTDGKHQNPHAAPARDQEMAKFVEEHDQAEDEQKGNEIPDNAAAERMQMRQKIRPHDACLTPPLEMVPAQIRR
jgi:hypothetical protein